MGDKSPKNLKKRALRVAHKVKPATAPTTAAATSTIDAIAKPAR